MRIHRDLAGWGVFFVVAGGVPLAIQTGLLDPAVLDRWWSYWPLILIGIGLGLILTRTALEIVGGLLVSATFGLFAAGILTAGFGGIGEFPSTVCGPGGGGTPFPAQSGSFVSDATVRVEIDCGTVEVRATDDDAWTVEGVDDSGVGPSVEADGESLDITPPDGDVGRFLGERDRWVVRLPTANRLDLHLTVDAGEAVTDLDNARLGTIEVDLNAGAASVNLADVTEIDGIDIGINAGSLGLYLPAVSTSGSIEANAGSVRLCAPEGVALRLDTSDSSLSSQDFASAGLVEVDGAWETPGYDTAVNRIELQTQANAGSFSLNPPEGCS